MAQVLEQFLRAIAQDPSLKARYTENPVAVMGQFGVSTEHQQMILSGDGKGLQLAMGAVHAVIITHVNAFRRHVA